MQSLRDNKPFGTSLALNAFTSSKILPLTHNLFAAPRHVRSVKRGISCRCVTGELITPWSREAEV